MRTLPPPDRMYRAVEERDSAFTGIFVVGVTTTGVFCRPGCAARTPRREHCRFFADPQDALRAGFRACLRCKPLAQERASRTVETLVDRIEREPGRRIADRDLHALGINPSTARRSFKKHCGMTFQAYQRARRMGVALHGIRSGKTVTRSAAESGYRSFSGFGAAFSRAFGKPPSKAMRAGCLLADWIATPLGPMIAVSDASGLWLLEFHDRRALEREIGWIRRRSGASIVPGTNAVLRQGARELDEYFAGRRRRFETPLHLAGSDFQVGVWNALLKIDAGATASYGDIAMRVGAPAAVRAVGRANGENRLAIVVPCHRVIRADGTLCGYGGGLWRKQWLLDHEAAMAQKPRASSAGVYSPTCPSARSVS